jgi:hypothetical protein
MKCDYGCGQTAKYQFKNGKFCCSDHYTRCPNIRKNMKGHLVSDSFRKRISEIHKGKILSEETKRKISNRKKGVKLTEEHKKKVSESLKGHLVSNETKKKLRSSNLGKNRSRETRIKNKLAAMGNKNMKGKRHKKETKKHISLINKKDISYYRKKYPFFSKIEEMRDNPDKPGEKEIQVHCKNHNCPNSKEQGGWFTPTYIQLYCRIISLEKPKGMIECNFYCCDKCKAECPIYGIRSDPLKDTIKPYTDAEYNIFRKYVLERDNYCCVYCGNKAEHVHHERPQKIEPFFALDPDLAWSCCEKCHYEKGHKDECSTGNLANKKCERN